MATVTLKPLAQQTIVITGGSSGIGLATARRAARLGAKVVVASRNEDALKEVVESIRRAGGTAAYAVADIGDDDAPERIAEVADREFGGFDTWVNNAASALYARLLDTDLQELRQVFDTGYFGLANASKFAVERLSTQGGALINVGSVLSDRAVPVQGAYSSMKHAVKGFTDALRVECEMDKRHVSVTLIKPNGINTPYPEHARNKMGTPARIPPVVYDPELVAKAICHAAAHQVRELTVGGQGFMLTTVGVMFPRATDKMMELMFGEQTQTIGTPPEPGTEDNLFTPKQDGRERSNQNIAVRKSSITLEMQMRPILSTVIALGGAAALAAFINGGRAKVLKANGGAPKMKRRMPERPTADDYVIDDVYVDDSYAADDFTDAGMSTLAPAYDDAGVGMDERDAGFGTVGRPEESVASMAGLGSDGPVKGKGSSKKIA